MDEKNIVTGDENNMEPNTENKAENTAENIEAFVSSNDTAEAKAMEEPVAEPANKEATLQHTNTPQPQNAQGMQPPVYNGNQAPNGRFVYYPNGTRVFVPNTQQTPYNSQPYGNQPYGVQPPQYSIPTPPPQKKKGKAGKVILIIALSIAILFSMGVFSVYVVPNLTNYPEEEDNDIYDSSAPERPSNPENSVGQEDEGDGSSSDDVSVPESVPVQPMPGETYDDLVSVYENCVDSCVTILCDLGFQGQSLGSGFIIEAVKDGEKGFYIITNHHVVEDANNIKVKYNDGKIYEATLVGSHALSDIAVLTTVRTDVKPIAMGDSKALKVGQTVVAIGTPSAEELQNTMSYGIISGLNRELQMTNDYGTVTKTMTVIQTTATLNPGNSGGPLINMAGQVIGINAMKLMQDYEGIGFALPSTEASYIISSLINFGKVIEDGNSFVSGTAQLGIQGYTVTDSVRRQLSLGDDCPDGVVVINVSRGTSVYEAGLSIYDVITEFNGTEVKDIETLKELLSKSKAGATVTLKFYRIGRRGEESKTHTIEFKLDSAQ